MVGHAPQHLDDGAHEADVVDRLGELDVAKVARRVGDAAAVGRALEGAVDGAEARVGEAAEARAAVFVGLARVDLGDGVAALFVGWMVVGGGKGGGEERWSRSKEVRGGGSFFFS